MLKIAWQNGKSGSVQSASVLQGPCWANAGRAGASSIVPAASRNIPSTLLNKRITSPPHQGQGMAKTSIGRHPADLPRGHPGGIVIQTVSLSGRSGLVFEEYGPAAPGGRAFQPVIIRHVRDSLQAIGFRQPGYAVPSIAGPSVLSRNCPESARYPKWRCSSGNAGVGFLAQGAKRQPPAPSRTSGLPWSPRSFRSD